MSGSRAAFVCAVAALTALGCGDDEPKDRTEPRPAVADRWGSLCEACGLDCDCRRPGIEAGRARISGVTFVDDYFALVLDYQRRADVAVDAIETVLADVRRDFGFDSQEDLDAQLAEALGLYLDGEPQLGDARSDCSLPPERLIAEAARCDDELQTPIATVRDGGLVSGASPSCALLARAHVELTAGCVPSPRRFEYALSDEGSSEERAAAERGFERLGLRLAMLDAAVAHAERVLRVGSDLTGPTRRAVEAETQALLDPAEPVHELPPAGLRCAVLDLPKVDALFDAPAARLDAALARARLVASP